MFLGLSAGGVLKADMVKRMGEKPLILALANSAVNPVIFGAGNMTIRRTLERCLRRRKTAAAGDDELYRSFQSLTDVRLREMQYAIPVRPAIIVWNS